MLVTGVGDNDGRRLRQCLKSVTNLNRFQHLLPTDLYFRKYPNFLPNAIAGKYLARKSKPISLANLEIFQIRLDDMFLISSMKGLVNRGLFGIQ